jgi:hypothetical protein
VLQDLIKSWQLLRANYRFSKNLIRPEYFDADHTGIWGKQHVRRQHRSDDGLVTADTRRLLGGHHEAEHRADRRNDVTRIVACVRDAS